jgi:hypothetical protein
MLFIEALPRQRTLAWIAIFALTGLVLRIAGASGGLWLDEAWSAVLADDVQTPMGVFISINHDNNHHLNSVWLQTVGLDAPPLVARALSIVAGTLAIVVAGLIGLRRGPLAGIVTALLFALSPVLVTLGSEARGYAPMTLCVLIAAWYIDRWLDGDESADRAITIAICFFLGALFQLTILFAACALTGWPFLALWQREGLRSALIKTAQIMGPALIAVLLATGIVFAPTVIGGAEFRFGSYQDFTVLLFLRGMMDLLGWMIGVTTISFWVPAGAVILVVLARSFGTPRLAFYWLAIVAFPLTVAALQTMNAGHGRYYLLAGLALLLLIGEAAAAAIRAGGWRAVAAGLGLAAFAGASAAADIDLIRNQRGDSAGSARALRALAPKGTDVMIDRETGSALMRTAAAQIGYDARMTRGCPAAPFLFVDWFNGEEGSTGPVTRCGVRYQPVAGARSRGISGQNWAVYRRDN